MLSDYRYSVEDVISNHATTALSDGSGGGDSRFWRPSLDKDVSEYKALVRLLPAGVSGLKNKLPSVVSRFMHYVRSGNRTHSLACRKTLGNYEKCPVCSENWNLKLAGDAANDENMRKRSRDRMKKESNVTNVLIIDDKNNPENNGKVFLWEHRKQVNQIIMNATEAKAVTHNGMQFKVEPFSPFCPIEGKNLWVVVTRDEKKFPTYAGSYWVDEKSQIAETENEMLGILDRCYPLDEFMVVPSAEELANEFNSIDDGGSVGAMNTPYTPSQPPMNATYTPTQPQVKPRAPEPVPSATAPPSIVGNGDDLDEDLPF